ncbi:farnesyl-diphosphate synthase [Corynebacterium phocae]|uniref:Isoprenyl transferase n=1 Tax=Corynebacterium phocae TaxID=161895 RepID=A0A1L7D6H0_9CORY|nr:isoprenyl transferase [Corynebacterium phocae]APT93749.1 farnesyl-diphosphate synthase [Corynebacterium phocae]KAA8723364.1 isoprenyl transferase [Corynebacterium phocae]
MPELPKILYPLYESRLLSLIKGKPQPKHIAIMADGNRRWAREAGFEDVSHGHRKGAAKISEMIEWCNDTEVKVVTIYLLSTENLKRSDAEVNLLFDIISDVVDHLAQASLNCQVRLVGHLNLLPDDVAKRMQESAQTTDANTGIIVNVAVGYGGRQEIVDAVRTLVADEAASGVPADQLAQAVTVDSITEHLYTKGLPDPDLVIRTSGEQRLSGFLLWQAAYSEIWFTDTYWPAFRKIDLLRALRDYSQRSRRFGK